MTGSFDSVKANRYTVSLLPRRPDTKDHLIDLSLVYIPSHTRHFSAKERGNAYFSPALPRNVGDGHFRRLAETGVRAYVMGGTAEGFFDEIVALKAGMRHAGMDVTFREVSGCGLLQTTMVVVLTVRSRGGVTPSSCGWTATCRPGPGGAG